MMQCCHQETWVGGGRIPEEESEHAVNTLQSKKPENDPAAVQGMFSCVRTTGISV